MDVWGPARVRGQGHKRCFPLVVEDYSRYTTVFPLRSKGEVPERRGVFLQPPKSLLLSEGIRQTFTLLASSQQNGIAERRIGMVIDVARMSMIHAAAPHFLWPFAVQYAAHQINLQPRVSLSETTPTLRWTGKVGDASVFRVWGSRAFVRDTTADKLSSRAVPCVFLVFPPNAPGWQFYHLTSRRVLSSQDVTFDESVSYYRLFPYRTTSPPPPRRSSSHQVDPAEPVEVAVDSGAASGAYPAGAGPGGAETGGAECGGAESGGALGVPSRREPLSLQRRRQWYSRRCRGAAGAGAAGGAGGATGATRGAGAAGVGAGAGATRGAAGPGAVGGAGGAARAAGGAAGAGATGGAGAAGGCAGVGAAGVVAGAGAAGAPGGARGAGGAGGGAGAGAAGGAAETEDLGAEGTGSVSAVSRGAVRLRPYYVPLLQQVLGSPPSPGPPPPFLSPPPVQSQSQLQPASPLPGPSPYFGPTRGLTERREPESRHVSPASRAASPVRLVRAGCVSRPRLPPVLGTHSMTLRPSTASQRVPLPSPPASSFPDGPDPESDSLRAASPTVTRFLATAVTDPLFESSAASALVAKIVDFAAACRLDYTTSLVAESASVCPPSIGGECALGTDVLEDRQEDLECFAAASPHLMSMLLALEGDSDALDIPTPRSYAEAIEGPYSSHWQSAKDAEMASWNSTGTYVDEVPPHGANIVSGMWIFRVKWPPSSPPAFKAGYVARGFSQRQGVDFFQTFSPTPKMTTLWVLLHVAAQRDYELHSLDFSTAFLQGSLHEEIWLRRPPGFTGSFPAGTQWSLRRPVYGLRQAPRQWHNTLRTTLAALGFAPSTADPSLFLRSDATLPPFYVLIYVDDLVFATADTVALAHMKSELQKRHTCTDLGELASYLGLRITRDRAQRTITLNQSHMVQQVLQRFGFTYSSPQSTPLPTGHSLSAPPSNESVEPSGPYLELVGCLITSGMGLVLGGRARVVLTGHADASWVDDLATQWSSHGYTFSLGSGSVSWRSTRSSSVLSSSCEAEIYAGAMAAQELRWLTYLLTDLGEAPRSPPVLYVDNKAMLALCQEHRLEHRTKHIALRCFLARELQQRGQLRLAYVASQANTADVFTKALQSLELQRLDGSTCRPQQQTAEKRAGGGRGGSKRCHGCSGWQLQMLDCFPTTLSYPPPHSSMSGSERERRGGCWLCRVSLATLSHSPRFPSPSPRNLSPPLTADPAEGRGRTGCRQLTPATPTSPPPHGGSCGREGGAALAAAHAGAGDGRWCWRTRPCAGAHGRTRLRAAMRARTQLRAAAAVFVTERGGAGRDRAGSAGRVTGRRSNGAVRAAQLVAMTADSLPSRPSRQSQLRARRAPRNEMATSPDSGLVFINCQRASHAQPSPVFFAGPTLHPVLPTASPPGSNSPNPTAPSSGPNVDAGPPSPSHRMTKRARHAYTASEKLYWLAMHDAQPDLSNRALAKLAGVQPCQIRDWKRLRERLQVAAGCRRRLIGGGRRAKWPLMELAMYRQFLNHRSKGLAVSVKLLKKWGSYYMKHRHPDVDFCASSRWTKRFRQRWNLAQ
ncbi:unnamed protein product [Closterium sp. NIES-54]